MSSHGMYLQKRRSQSWWLDTVFLMIILGSLFFIILGSRPLFVPDEGRYAEIAREMANSGNFITPYLNHIKYFEKPILYYWLEVAAIKLAGLNLWSLRSVNAFLSLMCCWLTYATARLIYDRLTGILAALILGTSALYFVMTHTISLDLPVTSFLTISLYAFLIATKEPKNDKRRFYIWAAAASSACAVLTKGLIGILFPVIIIGSWITLIGDFRILKRLYLASAIFIFLLIALPWHFIVGYQNPEFFYFYFIEQHFLRYATKGIGHYQPFWFFIPYLIIGFFPWVVFLPQALAKELPHSLAECKKYKNELFFLLWFFIIFTFFSFSKSKLIPYILPVFPPLAILVAHYVREKIKTKPTRDIKISYFVLVFLAIVLACTLLLFPQIQALPNQRLAIFYITLEASILFIGSIIACFCAFKNLSEALFVTFLTISFFLITAVASMPSIDTRTILPIVSTLKPLLQPEDEVVAFNQYYQDLPFYLERRVSILNWQNELTFGMKYQDTSDWMLDYHAFWTHWQRNKRMYILMSREDYQNFFHKLYPEIPHIVIAQTLTNVLILNKFI